MFSNIYFPEMYPYWILLAKISTEEWIFINTHLKNGIIVDVNSHIGNIRIGMNSWCKSIQVSNGGTCNIVG